MSETSINNPHASSEGITNPQTSNDEVAFNRAPRFHAGYTLTEADVQDLNRIAAVTCVSSRHASRVSHQYGEYLRAHDVPKAMLSETMAEIGWEGTPEQFRRIQDYFAFSVPLPNIATLVTALKIASA